MNEMNAHTEMLIQDETVTYWKSYLAKLPDGAIDAECVGRNSGDIAANTAARSSSLFLQLPQRGAGVVNAVGAFRREDTGSHRTNSR